MNAGLIVAAGAALGYTQYRDFILFRDNLKFKVTNVKVLWSQTNSNQLAFEAVLVINNPRDYRITAQATQLVLAFNKQPLTVVNRNTPYEIKPVADTSFKIIFNVPYNTAVPGIVQALQYFYQNYTITLELAGKINFSLFDVKFSTPIKII